MIRSSKANGTNADGWLVSLFQLPPKDLRQLKKYLMSNKVFKSEGFEIKPKKNASVRKVM